MGNYNERGGLATSHIRLNWGTGNGRRNQQAAITKPQKKARPPRQTGPNLNVDNAHRTGGPPSKSRTIAKKYLNEMCPQGIDTSHPVGNLLAEWVQLGCPTQTGRPWSKLEMWKAINRGPHRSSLSPKAIAHFKDESKEKVAAGQRDSSSGITLKMTPHQS